MNLLKSFFIALAPIWMMYFVIKYTQIIVETGEPFPALFVILSSLPFLVFLVMLFLNKKARTSKHLLSITTPAFVSLLIMMIMELKSPNRVADQYLIHAAIALVTGFMYVYWYSNNSREKSNLLEIGNSLPEFNVFDKEGDSISSSTFIGQKHLLFFIRGNWCPLCVAQIEEMVEQYDQLSRNGIQVAFISSQKQSHTQSLANRFNLDFKFYFDKNNQAAKELGLLHKAGLPTGFQALGYTTDTIYPTVLAINEEGKIIYSDQTENYRIRPEPKELLSVFN